MKINIKELRDEINNLNTLKNDYEDIYLNFYNELNNCSFFWKDNHSKKFIDNTNFKKDKVKNYINEIESVIDTYKYLLESYSKLGKNIRYNLNTKDKLINNIISYKARLEQIITDYNSLNYTYSDSFYNIIEDEKNIIRDSINRIDNLLLKVKDFYKEINEIDLEVKRRTSKIKIEYLNEESIEEYI